MQDCAPVPEAFPALLFLFGYRTGRAGAPAKRRLRAPAGSRGRLRYKKKIAIRAPARAILPEDIQPPYHTEWPDRKFRRYGRVYFLEKDRRRTSAQSSQT